MKQFWTVGINFQICNRKGYIFTMQGYLWTSLSTWALEIWFCTSSVIWCCGQPLSFTAYSRWQSCSWGPKSRKSVLAPHLLQQLGEWSCALPEKHSRAELDDVFMWESTLRAGKQDNQHHALLIAGRDQLARAMLEALPWWWGQGRYGRLTNAATTQIQNQGYELASTIYDMLEKEKGLLLQIQNCRISTENQQDTE